MMLCNAHVTNYVVETLKLFIWVEKQLHCMLSSGRISAGYMVFHDSFFRICVNKDRVPALQQLISSYTTFLG